jgi:CRISPR type I-D-associated protein Csc3/Cas10d
VGAVNIRNTINSPEELKDMISAQLMVLMRAIHSNNAEGRWVTAGDAEVKAIQEFSRFLVDEYFCKALRGDRAYLTGNKAALLEHTCEWLYRRMEDAEKAMKNL